MYGKKQININSPDLWKALNATTKTGGSVSKRKIEEEKGVSLSDEELKKVINAPQDPDGNALLHHAVFQKKCKRPIFNLIQMGANVNVRNKQGRTPIHLAIVSGLEKPLKELLKAEGKVDIDMPDAEGYTPLHLAVFQPHLLEILLEKKANAHIRHDQVGTPFEYAQSLNNQEAMKILKSYDFETRDSRKALEGLPGSSPVLQSIKETGKSIASQKDLNPEFAGCLLKILAMLGTAYSKSDFTLSVERNKVDLLFNWFLNQIEYLLEKPSLEKAKSLREILTDEKGSEKEFILKLKELKEKSGKSDFIEFFENLKNWLGQKNVIPFMTTEAVEAWLKKLPSQVKVQGIVKSIIRATEVNLKKGRRAFPVSKDLSRSFDILLEGIVDHDFISIINFILNKDQFIDNSLFNFFLQEQENIQVFLNSFAEGKTYNLASELEKKLIAAVGSLQDISKVLLDKIYAILFDKEGNFLPNLKTFLSSVNAYKGRYIDENEFKFAWLNAIWIWLTNILLVLQKFHPEKILPWYLAGSMWTLTVQYSDYKQANERVEKFSLAALKNALPKEALSEKSIKAFFLQLAAQKNAAGQTDSAMEHIKETMGLLFTKKAADINREKLTAPLFEVILVLAEVYDPNKFYPYAGELLKGICSGLLKQIETAMLKQDQKKLNDLQAIRGDIEKVFKLQGDVYNFNKILQVLGNFASLENMIEYCKALIWQMMTKEQRKNTCFEITEQEGKTVLSLIQTTKEMASEQSEKLKYKIIRHKILSMELAIAQDSTGQIQLLAAELTGLKRMEWADKILQKPFSALFSQSDIEILQKCCRQAQGSKIPNLYSDEVLSYTGFISGALTRLESLNIEDFISDLKNRYQKLLKKQKWSHDELLLCVKITVLFVTGFSIDELLEKNTLNDQQLQFLLKFTIGQIPFSKQELQEAALTLPEFSEQKSLPEAIENKFITGDKELCNLIGMIVNYCHLKAGKGTGPDKLIFLIEDVLVQGILNTENRQPEKLFEHLLTLNNRMIALLKEKLKSDNLNELLKQFTQEQFVKDMQAVRKKYMENSSEPLKRNLEPILQFLCEEIKAIGDDYLAKEQCLQIVELLSKPFTDLSMDKIKKLIQEGKNAYTRENRILRQESGALPEQNPQTVFLREKKPPVAQSTEVVYDK